MYIRYLVEQFLSPEDAEEFARWAFGEEFMTMNISRDGFTYWNEHHKDLLELKSDGQPIDDIVKMIELWKCYKGCVKVKLSHDPETGKSFKARMNFCQMIKDLLDRVK